MPVALARLIRLALAAAAALLAPALVAAASAPAGQGGVAARLEAARLPILDAAVDRGLAWVLAQGELEVGDLYVLQQLSRPAAGERASREIGERAGSLGAFEGLVRPGALAPKSADWKALKGQRYEPLALWLYHAANAPGIPVPESVMADLLKGEYGEYLLAHQVLALRILGERGVIGGPGLEARMSALLDSLEAEQRTETTFSDLFAEREAILLSGGRVAGETSAWIARILAAQEADGRWRVPPHRYPTTLNEIHATLVSLWALDEYARHLRGASAHPVTK